MGAKTFEELVSTQDTNGFDHSRDIIDTTPADGNVWKMLLGAVNDWFDDDHDRYTNGDNRP